MIITQRSYSQTTTFQFDDDTLTHSRSDCQGSHALTLPYGSIGMEPRIISERNGTLFSGGLLLILWGTALCAYHLLQGDILGLLFLFPGLSALALHGFMKTTITLLNSDAGEIAIFHGKHFDSIMQEIRARRKGQLLEWYGKINFANDPEDEIRKFTWLHTQDLIDDKQLESIITTIRESDSSLLEEPEDPSAPRQ